jgi:hypothetical protein
MRVDTFLTFLAQALLEVRTYSVGRILILIRILHTFKFVDILIKGIEKVGFFFKSFLFFFALKLLSLKFSHADIFVFDGNFNTFDKAV